MELINKSPFITENMLLKDRLGRDLLVVILKCSYSFSSSSQISTCEQQVPVHLEDSFIGDPGESSIKYASAAVPVKPGTDIVHVGHAYAPDGLSREFNALLKVGHISKICRIVGNRRWEKSISGFSLTPPEQFIKMPLVYEKSFGGKDQSSPDNKEHEYEGRNPLGCGFMAKNSKLDPVKICVPNIEDPAELITSPQDRPKPAGFSFYGRDWQPRLTLAGTYDSKWKENNFPLLPVDFNEKYYNSAHPDLITPVNLQGGEIVEIVNLSPLGRVKFQLPAHRPKVAVISYSLETTALEPRFDTLVLEPDLSRFSMVWRASLPVHNAIHTVACVRVIMNA